MTSVVRHRWKGVTMELENVIEIVSKVMGIDKSKITAESKFEDDLQADSLDLYQIIMAIEEQYNIEISDEDAAKIVTVGDAAEKLENAIN